jgi:hypothetical protein
VPNDTIDIGQNLFGIGIRNTKIALYQLGAKSLQQIGDDKYGKRKTKLLGIYEM